MIHTILLDTTFLQEECMSKGDKLLCGLESYQLEHYSSQNAHERKCGLLREGVGGCGGGGGGEEIRSDVT